MNSRTLCLIAAATIALATYLAACGGSSTNITPPPATGNFSNASLKGQYAFSMSGVDLISGAYIARIGSIAADGNGHITSGLEDVQDLGSTTPTSQVSFSSGTYQIQANGRGVIVLAISTGGTLQWSVSLQSSSQGYLSADRWISLDERRPEFADAIAIFRKRHQRKICV